MSDPPAQFSDPFYLRRFPTDRRKIGKAYEIQAEKYLTDKGYRILERNYCGSHGEIDRIARAADGTIVFVEVKARRTLGWGSGGEAVDSAKRRHIRLTARAYIYEKGLSFNGSFRFDVILFEKGQLIHIENAF